ncbi:hypothetical protein EOI86_06355 [Hwanghaeella grinnelliae]|uniref:Uncharacterized protein n=1 Tax=Hwanghaeella grinnelliae TaxID=2500179 RepID=A0A3S2Y595_9PROT|nr:hypothetical protein [Hwanghaeella grinnelliae]RVU38884.1 hypothetical protein EOI86_06355 [Hwanghaeella grinnelliae]
MGRQTTAFQMVATILLFLTGCNGTANLSGFEASLNQAGYSIYYPLRENWGPNYVILGDLKDKKLVNVEEICPEGLFEYERSLIRNSNVILANYSGHSDRDFSIGASLLEKVFGPSSSAKLGVETKQSSNVKIALTNTSEDSIATSELIFDQTGMTRPIKKQCLARVKQLLDQGNANRLFVVVRAIKGQLRYEFSETNLFKAEAGLTLAKQVGASAGANWKAVGDTGLEVGGENPFFLGVASQGGLAKIADILPTGLASANIRRVILEPVDVLEVQ